MYGQDRHGWHRYGISLFEDPGLSPFNETVDTGISPFEAFGSGVAVKSTDEEGISWDIFTDHTGDMAATMGWDELRKDLAWRVSTNIYEYLYSLQRETDKTKIRRKLEKTFEEDSRIRSSTVEDIKFGYNNDPDTMGIISSVDAYYDKRGEFVFPI